jgi:hypothetical protein
VIFALVAIIATLLRELKIKGMQKQMEGSRLG